MQRKRREREREGDEGAVGGGWGVQRKWRERKSAGEQSNMGLEFVHFSVVQDGSHCFKTTRNIYMQQQKCNAQKSGHNKDTIYTHM